MANNASPPAMIFIAEHKELVQEPPHAHPRRFLKFTIHNSPFADSSPGIDGPGGPCRIRFRRGRAADA
jgi:hypothetical protein